MQKKGSENVESVQSEADLRCMICTAQIKLEGNQLNEWMVLSERDG